MTHSSAILLLPGTLVMTERIAHFIKDRALIIAVDGGIEHAKTLNMTPDLWIGDFDSSSLDDQTFYHSIPHIVHPREKSEVDTELAISEAIRRGFNSIIMLGGMGGRLDHQMALLMLPLQYSATHFIYSDGIQFLETLTDSSYTFQAQKGDLISILPLQDLKGVTLKGTKWPLHDADLNAGYGLSISNEAEETAIEASCEAGRGWLYHAPPPKTIA